MSPNLKIDLDNPPTTLAENEQYREILQRESLHNGVLQREIIRRSARDPIWFATVMVRTRHGVGFWSEEAQKRLKDRIPFLLYPKQIEFVTAVVAAVREPEKDARICLKKSREQGATWMMCLVIVYFYLFMREFRAAVGSQLLIDVDGKRGSFFGQIDYILANLQKDWPWFEATKFPRPSGAHHRATKSQTFGPNSFKRRGFRLNHVTQSELVGRAANDNFIRSERLDLAVLDEVEAIERKHPGVVDEILGSAESACRVFVLMSTLDSDSSPFAELFENEQWQRFSIHWTESPHCRAGYYECQPGKCPHPLHRSGGFPHSTWYDDKCASLKWDPIKIGKEYDMRPFRVGTNAFNVENIDAVTRVLMHPEFKGPQRGRLQWTCEPPNPRNDNVNVWENFTVEWQPDPGGGLLVYRHPEPGHKYAIGADPATGTGDNCAAYVLDVTEQGFPIAVAEWCECVEPTETADAIAMLARYYETGSGTGENIPLAIERNSYGVAVVGMVRNFGAWVLKSEAIQRRGGTKTRDGVFAHSSNKVASIAYLMQPIINNKGVDDLPILTVPFIEFWAECRNFEVKRLPSGATTMQAAKRRRDDRVMAMLHTLSAAERIYQAISCLGIKAESKDEYNQDVF